MKNRLACKRRREYNKKVYHVYRTGAPKKRVEGDCGKSNLWRNNDWDYYKTKESHQATHLRRSKKNKQYKCKTNKKPQKKEKTKQSKTKLHQLPYNKDKEKNLKTARGEGEETDYLQRKTTRNSWLTSP